MSIHDFWLVECDNCNEYTWETDRKVRWSKPDWDGQHWIKRPLTKEQARSNKIISWLVCTPCQKKINKLEE